MLFMLEGIRETSIQTINLIRNIKKLMQQHKQTLRKELPKLYSQDLLNNLFHHPYTKIAFVENELKVSRITATRYLDELDRIDLMKKIKLGRDSYYINTALINLLSDKQIT